ncbi:MAG TPA: thymidylate kinase [Candidatus Saccharimonadia bacterium]
MTKPGLFIVIEGTDGAGKGTQTELLHKRLSKEGHKIAVFDFPQYGKPSAHFVERYLNGKYGSVDEVNVYQASLYYAMDRLEAGFAIREALADGKIVLANRYVGSNMAHQGARFADSEERKAFFEWIEDLEFGLLGIPRPDLNVVLHMPAALAQKLVDKKKQREYLGTKKRDIHEDDLHHLQKAEQAYLEMAKLFPTIFHLIECAEGGKVATKKEVSEKVWSAIKAKLPR